MQAVNPGSDTRWFPRPMPIALSVLIVGSVSAAGSLYQDSPALTLIPFALFIGLSQYASP